MKKIFYIGYYDTPDSSEKRNCVLAATNKMTYIISTLEKFYEEITVISHSGSGSKKSYPAQIKNVSPITKLSLPFALGTGFILKRVLQRLILNIQLLYKLLFWIKKDDQVIVYHSLGYLTLLKLAKKIKKFRLILEVEEIYGDVIGSRKVSEKELHFFSLADAYILPTELLNKKINIDNKPHTIIYGTYQVESPRKRLFNDGKIHCVYAGTFDPRKGGAAAAAAAEFLDDRFHMHILGFGTEKDTEYILATIDKTSKKSSCTLTYDGLLSGEEYIQFIQSCDIGLSTQNPDAEFNDTSFPSKVLSYMANGLRVVSVKIPALEQCAVNNLLYYCEKNTPQAIAKAIKDINFNNDYDSRKRVKELDMNFCHNLKVLMES